MEKTIEQTKQEIVSCASFLVGGYNKNKYIPKGKKKTINILKFSFMLEHSILALNVISYC